MANFNAHKVVAALPATLTPNGIYFVRSGLGYVQYVVDSSGAIARPMNNLTRIDWSGRILLRANERWVGFNTLYGRANQNIQQNYGSGANPTVTETGSGFPLAENTHVRAMRIRGYADNATVDGMRVQLYFAVGATLTLVDDFTFTLNGTSAVDLAQTISYVTPSNGVLIPVFVRTGTLNNNRYFYAAGSFDLERMGVI